MEKFRVWMKHILGDKITRVEVSTRLVDSPATIVQSEYGCSPSMQKYLKAQAVMEEDKNGQYAQIFNQAVLEINPDHAIIKHLQRMHDSDPEGKDSVATVELMFNTAALAAGYLLDNAADYAQMIVKLLTQVAESQQKHPMRGGVTDTDTDTEAVGELVAPLEDDE